MERGPGSDELKLEGFKFGVGEGRITFAVCYILLLYSMLGDGGEGQWI